MLRRDSPRRGRKHRPGRVSTPRANHADEDEDCDEDDHAAHEEPVNKSEAQRLSLQVREYGWKSVTPGLSFSQ